jgi:hypothetical protein
MSDILITKMTPIFKTLYKNILVKWQKNKNKNTRNIVV